jgi:hypothetical protein
MDNTVQSYRNEMNNMFHTPSYHRENQHNNQRPMNGMLHTPGYHHENQHHMLHAPSRMHHDNVECKPINTVVVGNSITKNEKNYTAQENANWKCCSGNAVLQSGNNYLCQ